METNMIESLGLPKDAFLGQVVVITGSGRGIGREMALAFAQLRARVVLAEVNVAGASVQVEAEAFGGQACFIQTDVSDPASVENMVRRTAATFGPVDLLINNAILCPVASVVEMPVDLWDRVMAVNLRGTFLTCKACLPAMLERKRGTIINMISADAMPQLSAYIASKKGIEAFGQSLAIEVGGQGVHVVSLAVGMVDTPGIHEIAGQLAPHLGLTREQFLGVSLHPAYEGLMPPAHAAAAAVYLTARLAVSYHGETLTGYEVLEMAGVLPKLSAPQAQVEASAGDVLGAALPSANQALALASCFSQIIADTEAEFNQLPVFVRPLARRGFKGKSGQSLQEWQRTAAQLEQHLQALMDGQASAQAALCADLPGLQEALEKLNVYYREVPAETARLTRDQEMLRRVRQISDERQALIQGLLESLAGIMVV